MRRVSRPFPISVKVVYRPAFCLPAPRCTLEKPQKQMESRIWKKTLKTPPKCEMPLGRRQVWCRETAGGQSRWMARVEQRFNSLPMAWPWVGQSGLWLQKPAASAQVARVVREYSSITEALLGWGADKKNRTDSWYLAFTHSPLPLQASQDEGF